MKSSLLKAGRQLNREVIFCIVQMCIFSCRVLFNFHNKIIIMIYSLGRQGTGYFCDFVTSIFWHQISLLFCFFILTRVQYRRHQWLSKSSERERMTITFNDYALILSDYKARWGFLLKWCFLLSFYPPPFYACSSLRFEQGYGWSSLDEWSFCKLFLILRAVSLAAGSEYQHSDMWRLRLVWGSMASQTLGTSGLIMSRQTTFLISSREGSTPTRSQYGGW